MNPDSLFLGALSTLLVEIFEGPPGNEAFVLNPKDPGLLRQLEALSHEVVSQRPMAGTTTIAAHADHMRYGLSLLNRWGSGEANPWAGADWTASWKRTNVTADEWHTLCAKLRQASKTWQAILPRVKDWNALTAAGALASAAHTAYHLGAIRQILAAMNANTAPRDS